MVPPVLCGLGMGVSRMSDQTGEGPGCHHNLCLLCQGGKSKPSVCKWLSVWDLHRDPRSYRTVSEPNKPILSTTPNLGPTDPSLGSRRWMLDTLKKKDRHLKIRLRNRGNTDKGVDTFPHLLSWTEHPTTLLNCHIRYISYILLRPMSHPRYYTITRNN